MHMSQQSEQAKETGMNKALRLTTAGVASIPLVVVLAVSARGSHKW